MTQPSISNFKTATVLIGQTPIALQLIKEVNVSPVMLATMLTLLVTPVTFSLRIFRWQTVKSTQDPPTVFPVKLVSTQREESALKPPILWLTVRQRMNKESVFPVQTVICPHQTDCLVLKDQLLRTVVVSLMLNVGNVPLVICLTRTTISLLSSDSETEENLLS